jgi:sorbitol-specific phosphotransferase system component IIBC
MSIFYWSVANLLYSTGADTIDASFHNTSRSVSIFFICIITVSTLGRWFFNPLGGLYMAKRILIATILAAAYLDKTYLAPLVLLETVFTVFRYFM